MGNGLVDAALDRIKAEKAAEDAVNRPAHYRVGGYECLDVIEALGLGFHLGNALKYLWRAGRKDQAKTVEDLKKAVFYIQREIAKRERDPLEETRRCAQTAMTAFSAPTPDAPESAEMPSCGRACKPTVRRCACRYRALNVWMAQQGYDQEVP